MGVGVEREQQKASEQVGRLITVQASRKLITPIPIMIGLFECPTKSKIQNPKIVIQITTSQPLIEKRLQLRTLLVKI